jgi:curved DNA-binding protein CbpA
METMRRRFGFSEGMTYQQARQQYWALAMELHPDRTGGDPDAAERLQDLNNAWACTRDRFRSNRARPACFAGAR